MTSVDRTLTTFGLYSTRFDIDRLVRGHTEVLTQRGSDRSSEPISPHLSRHTSAVHLLEAAVEGNEIRAWIVHVSVEPTNRYAELTIA
ncbi:MAG: integrase, partial [Gammaproteobacteria bacterium]|nr:integrase [Gammaproteobacteria bacterium]